MLNNSPVLKSKPISSSWLPAYAIYSIPARQVPRSQGQAMEPKEAGLGTPSAPEFVKHGEMSDLKKKQKTKLTR